jgi:hypothetical protein
MHGRVGCAHRIGKVQCTWGRVCGAGEVALEVDFRCNARANGLRPSPWEHAMHLGGSADKDGPEEHGDEVDAESEKQGDPDGDLLDATEGEADEGCLPGVLEPEVDAEDV